MLTRVLDTCLGCALAMMDVARTRGAWRSAYWRWRWETAFGRGVPPFGERVGGLAEFARWSRRVRRGG